MNDSKPNQPLISDIYDLINLPSDSRTPLLHTTNLNQTYDVLTKKKMNYNRKGRNYTNTHSVNNNTFANTKGEMVQEFIQNEKLYEQQKQLKLNELKNKMRMKTFTSLQKVPEIDSKSNSIAQKQNNKPIYDRTDEVTQKRQENIETLRSFYTKALKKEEHQTTKGKVFTGYPEKTMKWVHKQQNDWLKKKLQSSRNEGMDIDENQISKARITQTQSTNNDKQLTKDSNINIAKSTFNIKKELLHKETYPSFTPMLNRNRSETSRLYPNYIPLNPKKRITKSNNSSKRTKNRSVDCVLIERNKNNRPKIEHWSSLLFNLKKNQENDKEYMYRINIFPSGAWNENSLTNVNMNGFAKKIISHLLS